MKYKTRYITEGAMMVAFIATLLILNRQTANLMEGILYWLIALPMSVYLVRNGTQSSIIVYVSCMLVALMFSTITTIFYLFAGLSTGFIYGYGLLKRWRNRILLVLSIVSQLILNFIVVVVFAELFGYNIMDEFKDIITIVAQFDFLDNSSNLTIMVLVVIYIGSSILTGIVLHVITHQVLLRLRCDIEPLKDLRDIALPKGLGIVVVVGWGLYMLSSLHLLPKEWDVYIFVLYIIAFLIGTSNGILAGMAYAIHIKNRALVMAVMIAAFIPGLNNLVLWFGIYDIFSGFHVQLGK